MEKERGWEVDNYMRMDFGMAKRDRKISAEQTKCSDNEK